MSKVWKIVALGWFILSGILLVRGTVKRMELESELADARQPVIGGVVGYSCFFDGPASVGQTVTTSVTYAGECHAIEIPASTENMTRVPAAAQHGDR